MTVNISRTGSEFQVNTQPLGNQANAVVAALANGGFVIAWEDGGAVGGDTSSDSIKAQVFAADGSKLGAEISVNTTTTNSQSSATITVLANGNFVIGWNDWSESPAAAPFTAGDVRAQVFTASGTSVGTELRLNAITSGDQGALDIAATADGGFVAVWQDNSGIGDDTDFYGIKGQRFAADGAPLGNEFRVNTGTTGNQNLPSVAVGADGSFLISWQDGGRAPDIGEIRGQMFRADGSRLGTELAINSDAFGLQSNSSVVASAGGYFVTWLDNSGGGAFVRSVEGASFDSLGQPLGTDILINAPTTTVQIGGNPFVTPDDGFIVPFTSRNVPGDPATGITARIYASANRPLTGEFSVNTVTDGSQFAPAGAVLANGDIVFAWTNGSANEGDGSGEGIKAQLFSIGSTTTGAGDVDGTFGADQLTGSDDRDYLRGGAGADTLVALGGDDQLDGGTGDDLLIGGEGNDILTGGTGNDSLVGGTGDDSYFVDRQDDLVFENPGPGNDTVLAVASFYLYANIENLTLTGTGNTFGVGNDLANILTGNSGENLLIGGDGSDSLRGGAARDALFGEGGDDQLFGDAGVDYLVAGIGNDTVDGGADADEIYGQDGDDTLSGGASFDTDIIVGGSGNDTIRGDGGLGDYDLLYGNEGNDSFHVDTPADLVFEQGDEGFDTVFANISGAGFYLYANIEDLVLLGATPFGVGNDLANTLTGNTIGNYLLGGAGNDTLNGKAGNDVLFGESGADTFVFDRGTGGDVIGDFQPGTDRIQLTGLGISTFAQLQSLFVENGGTTAIDLGSGDLIVLNGIANAQLSAADFLFA